MKNKIAIIILFVILIIVSSFIVLNFTNIVSKKKINNNQTKITTTLSMSSDKVFESVIIIEGLEETVKYKTYNSYLGYTFDYMIDYFNVINSSNNSIEIRSILNNDNYIKIEKIEELKYSNEYKRENEEIKNGFKYNYFFIKGKDKYLKITKCVLDNPEYQEGISIRMDYIINSIKL